MSERDPIERIVADALSAAGVAFVRESALKKDAHAPLDFYIPQSGVYIECKQFHTPRIAEQMAKAPDIIVIQGRKAAEQFAAMLRS